MAAANAGLNPRRWDLAAVGGVALALWALGQTGGAFFLHFDTPTQDVAALDWARGCWEYSTSKILPVVLLGPFLKILPPSPLWETLLLLAAFVVSAAAAYELARLFTGSRLAGVFSALLLLALPVFHYFGRTHLGYPMPFLLLAWLAVWHRRWAWAGLGFGLAIAAHYNSWVPVGLSLAVLGLLFNPLWPSRPTRWRDWLALLAGLALPLLAMDALFFLYSGQWFEWDRGVFSEIFRLSRIDAATPHPDWLWVWRMNAGSNGWLLAATLALGLGAPFVLRRERVGLACSLALVVLAALYTVQAGLGRALLVSRVLATAYPFWALCAGCMLASGVEASAGAIRKAVIVVLAAALLWGGVASALFIRQFSQTPYRQIGAWVQAAKEADQPVRYTGNRWIGLWYAQIAGAEILANDTRWIDAGTPGQAVLIFEEAAPANLNAEGYTVETFDLDFSADSVHPVLTEEAGLPRHAEAWWPAGPAAPLQLPEGLPPYASYYSGSGCLIPPAYGDGTLHFYQLVWNRLTRR